MPVPAVTRRTSCAPPFGVGERRRRAQGRCVYPARSSRSLSVVFRLRTVSSL
jgi:hypothetical protein